MPDDPEIRRTLSESAARQLANATKTRAQWSGITPRWLVSFLPWSPVEAGIYRLNRVNESEALTDADVECSPARDRDADLPETFVDYEEAPREYSLNAVTTVLDVQTRVSDLYSHPYDQQAQLLLNLVVGMAVEIGNAGLDVENGGDGVERIFARRVLVIDEGFRQVRVAVARRAALDVGVGQRLAFLDAVQAIDAGFDRRPGQKGH